MLVFSFLGGKPAPHQKTLPSANLTFLFDCTPGKVLSQPVPPLRPQAPRLPLRRVTPPMKTYLVFCGDNQIYHTQEVQVGRDHFTQAKETMKPGKDMEAPDPQPVTPPCMQQAPEAKKSPLKTVPLRCSSSGAAKGLLKGLLSSCSCGRGHANGPEEEESRPISRAQGLHFQEPHSSSPAQQKSMPRH